MTGDEELVEIAAQSGYSGAGSSGYCLRRSSSTGATSSDFNRVIFCAAQDEFDNYNQQLRRDLTDVMEGIGEVDESTGMRTKFLRRNARVSNKYGCRNNPFWPIRVENQLTVINVEHTLYLCSWDLIQFTIHRRFVIRRLPMSDMENAGARQLVLTLAVQGLPSVVTVGVAWYLAAHGVAALGLGYLGLFVALAIASLAFGDSLIVTNGVLIRVA